MSNTTTVKIRYRIDIVGWYASYLADYCDPDKDHPNVYTCTHDLPINDADIYATLAWRTFNCPHIVTRIDPPMMIEVRPEGQAYYLDEEQS